MTPLSTSFNLLSKARRTMHLFPQEILDAIVDWVQFKADLESLSLTHSTFLPRTRWHLFFSISLGYGKTYATALNYGELTVIDRSHVQHDSLSAYLANFRSCIAQNQMIVSSVHRLSFFLVPDSDHGHDMDEIPEYLPFTNLLTLQARIAHLYHDVIEARTIQRWRLPRIAGLIQNNPCLEHLAIDTCNLEVPSWDVLFSHISGLKQLHTLVLCDAVIATQVPDFLDEGALSIDSPVRESQTMIQLKRLYLEGVEPELEREFISTSRYFSILHLDALALRCHRSLRHMWGHRAVLASCANSITSLTISSADNLPPQSLPAFPLPSFPQNILRGLIFSRLTHFQFECRYGYTLLLGDIMNWLTEDKVPSLQHLHLTAHSLPVAACPSIDHQLCRLSSSVPSLQLITAEFTISEYGFTSQEGTKCLETNFPESFGTGILKYRQMLEWWQI
ncbi:MAG: hypothetical protein NXY57DRAFT_976055 [Lentinula lateritia]|nr:MAG: hypothetical protein NXY57DRAFT_976055 [Lentinula lateritia]